MWHFGICFSRNGSVGWMVGLDDLRSLFQPMTLQFYDTKEEIFYNEGGETLEQIAQRGGRCPIPGNI